MLVGRDLPSAGGETESGGSDPHIWGLSESEEKHLRLKRETADLWQPKWIENQTVLA